MCFYTSIHLNAQISEPKAHEFKLPGENIEDAKYKNIAGIQQIDKYKKVFKTIENSDSVTYIEFFEYGKKWFVYRYILRNGKPFLDGWQNEYDFTGKLVKKRFCEFDDRKCKKEIYYAYYPGNQLMSVANYYDGKPEGLHTYYYADGKIREVIQFKNGNLMNVLEYYDAEGNLLDPGNFCDGEGIINIYSMNGKLIQKKIFHKGKITNVITIAKD